MIDFAGGRGKTENRRGSLYGKEYHTEVDFLYEIESDFKLPDQRVRIYGQLSSADHRVYRESRRDSGHKRTGRKNGRNPAKFFKNQKKLIDRTSTSIYNDIACV